MKKMSLLLALPLMMVACSSDDAADTNKPTITIAEPTALQKIGLGTNMHLHAVLTDNKELASYKIEIHSAEDGHEHRSTVEEFHYEFIQTIGGTTHTIDREIAIPTNITQGHYHIGVFVLDKAGNQNQQFVEVILGEDDPNHNH